MTNVGTDLNSLMDTKSKSIPRPDVANNKKTAVQVGKQILLALKDLHSIGYIHCDMKLDNICGLQDNSTSEFKYSLIDFGLVQKYETSGSHI
jgi:serine/threonine protein kinase